MKRKEFENGTVFKIKDAEGEYQFDGRVLKRKYDTEYFDYYSNIDEISGRYFIAPYKFLNWPIKAVILFKNCTIIK